MNYTLFMYVDHVFLGENSHDSLIVDETYRKFKLIIFVVKDHTWVIYSLKFVQLSTNTIIHLLFIIVVFDVTVIGLTVIQLLSNIKIP